MLMAICRYFGRCLVNCQSFAVIDIWAVMWVNEYKCLHEQFAEIAATGGILDTWGKETCAVLDISIGLRSCAFTPKETVKSSPFHFGVYRAVSWFIGFGNCGFWSL